MTLTRPVSLSALDLPRGYAEGHVRATTAAGSRGGSRGAAAGADPARLPPPLSPPMSPTSTLRRAASHMANLKELKSTIAKSSAILRRIGSPPTVRRTPGSSTFVRSGSSQAPASPPVIAFHQPPQAASFAPQTSTRSAERILATASSVGSLHRSSSTTCGGGGGGLHSAAPFRVPGLPTPSAALGATPSSPLQKPIARRAGAFGSSTKNDAAASASEQRATSSSIPAPRQTSPELARAAIERPVTAVAMSAAWAASWAAGEASSALYGKRIIASPARGFSAGALGDARRRGAAAGFGSAVDRRPPRPWTGQPHHGAPLPRQTQPATRPKLSYLSQQSSRHRPHTSPSARRTATQAPRLRDSRPMTAGAPPMPLSIAGQHAFPGGPRRLFSE